MSLGELLRSHWFLGVVVSCRRVIGETISLGQEGRDQEVFILVRLAKES